MRNMLSEARYYEGLACRIWFFLHATYHWCRSKSWMPIMSLVKGIGGFCFQWTCSNNRLGIASLTTRIAASKPQFLNRVVSCSEAILFNSYFLSRILCIQILRRYISKDSDSFVHTCLSLPSASLAVPLYPLIIISAFIISITFFQTFNSPSLAGWCGSYVESSDRYVQLIAKWRSLYDGILI